MNAPRDRGNRPRSPAPATLDGGAEFLLANQGPDGLWRDFETPAGEASSWPTAFIATALHAAAVGQDAQEGAAEALAATQNDDGGWGYNEDVPSDADSTAWALLFLSRMSREERACRRAVSCLLRHQREANGGIATYAEPGPIRRFMGVGRWMPFGGWCRPHTEVTAVAGRALMACSPDGRDPAADSAWRFVRSRQNATGDWSSYWWTSPHYTTAQAVELAAARGEPDVIARAAVWALRNQADVASGAFATAMSLSILVRAGADAGALDRAVQDLVALQQADGGWPSEPIMRIPVPADKDPNGEDRWRVVRFGGGIDVTDQHRLFTSAACVAALAG
jgi:squalene cyclase